MGEHTLPDYQTKYKMTTIFGQIDTGELAARLGSIITHDRRGNVIWMTDFEGVDTNDWTVTKSGVADQYLSTEEHYRGTQSLKIITGAASVNDITLKRPIPLPVIGRMGMEMAIMHPAGGYEFFMSMDLYDGTTLHQARVKYVVADEKWYYLNSGGTYTEIAGTGAIPTTTNLFSILKLVADYNTGKYVRFILNDVQYDMSASYYTTPDPVTPAHMSFEFFYDGDDGTASIDVFLDNIIFTQNEP